MNREMNPLMHTQETDTIIGPSVHIEGDLASKGNIRIEGEFKGKLDTESDIEISETAKVEANVTASNMVIAGELNGDIKALGKISILESGKVYGDITCATLAINPGAVFSGNSNMNLKQKQKSKDEEKIQDTEVELNNIVNEQKSSEQSLPKKGIRIAITK